MPRRETKIIHEPWCDHELHEHIDGRDLNSGEDIETCVAALTKVGEEGRGDAGPFAYIDLRESSDRNGEPVITVEMGGVRSPGLSVHPCAAVRFADELEQHVAEVAAAIRKAAALVEVSA